MSTEELVARIESLPDDLQREVIDFIDFHLARLNQIGTHKLGGVPGLAKGRITIPDDFDEPRTESRSKQE